MKKISLDDIFKNLATRHRLTLFTRAAVSALEKRLFLLGDRPYVKCLASDKDRPAKPEEIVRQLWIEKLMKDYGYPKERIRVEHAVWFGSGVSDKSADIVLMHEDKEHLSMIFEVKKPKRKDGEQQLKSYCNAEGSPIGVWSNGEELVILHRQDPNIFQAISEIPAAGQTLLDVISEQWTIDKLKQENKLVKERLSLKKIILDLEDLVLANAEGIDDSFDEVFKLIYAKLYDEWAATNDPARKRKLQFRIYGETPPELYSKINGLFYRAKEKWRGIFGLDEKIKLKPGHLLTCVSFMQDVKLFNANLQVIDEAFEYLITEVAKGKKGQYFTPRWVIDSCVQMLNPKINERVIDTACGSSGFTVHSIFHVANKQFTAAGLPPHIVEYAANMVYAIDSSPKAVKIAKALNLIAGDGKTNVYELSSLNPSKWTDDGKAAFRPLLQRFPENLPEDDKNQREFQYFDFDILLTNPPFAGNISEREILRQYKLAEKNGRTINKVGRDIIFIERNLNFLKPGGRMAIVLPQGRFNNTGDVYLRNFIMDRARILAVVGLHDNTFKPHTGTRTSILFLQKYTDEESRDIQGIKEGHLAEWDKHYSEIKKLIEKKVEEEGLPKIMQSFLASEFEEFSIEDGQEGGDEESESEIEERIESLETQLADLAGRAKGRAELRRAIRDAKRKLAGLTIVGQLRWVVEDDDRMLERYKGVWLAGRAAKELNYPIFFAVSRKSGKDNSGDPIYKRDKSGELLLDEHGHLVVDHDLDDIVDEFKKFGKRQKFEFVN